LYVIKNQSITFEFSHSNSLLDLVLLINIMIILQTITNLNNIFFWTHW